MSRIEQNNGDMSFIEMEASKPIENRRLSNEETQRRSSIKQPLLVRTSSDSLSRVSIAQSLGRPSVSYGTRIESHYESPTSILKGESKVRSSLGNASPHIRQRPSVTYASSKSKGGRGSPSKVSTSQNLIRPSLSGLRKMGSDITCRPSLDHYQLRSASSARALKAKARLPSLNIVRDRRQKLKSLSHKSRASVFSSSSTASPRNPETDILRLTRKVGTKRSSVPVRSLASSFVKKQKKKAEAKLTVLRDSMAQTSFLSEPSSDDTLMESISSNISPAKELDIEVCDEEDEYRTTLAKIMFLKHMHDLPNIDSLSESTSTSEESDETKKITIYDAGKVAAPKDSNSSSSRESLGLGAASLTDTYSESSFISSAQLGYEDYSRESCSFLSNEALPSLLSSETTKDSELDIIEWEQRRNEKLLKQISTMNEDQRHVCESDEKSTIDIEAGILDSAEVFLNDIIDHVVQYCESLEVTQCRVLDKKVLMEDLIELWEEYQTESKLNTSLNKRMVEYYLRKRIVYPLTPTNAEAMHEKKYRAALLQVNHELERDRLTQLKCDEQLSKLRAEEAEFQNEAEAAVESFENLVRSTVNSRVDLKRVPIVVEEQLRRMAKLRQQITEERLKLILKQHTFADIKARVQKIEEVGEIMRTMAEVQMLMRKIEDRNAEMNRMHKKVNNEWHATAHVRSKCQLLRLELKEVQQEVAEKRVEQRELRECLHAANVEQNRIRREMSELRSAGSLLQYPALLRDYDKTVEHNEIQSEIVSELRKQHDALVAKIEAIESRHRIRKNYQTKGQLAAQVAAVASTLHLHSPAKAFRSSSDPSKLQKTLEVRKLSSKNMIAKKKRSSVHITIDRSYEMLPQTTSSINRQADEQTATVTYGKLESVKNIRPIYGLNRLTLKKLISQKSARKYNRLSTHSLSYRDVA